MSTKETSLNLESGSINTPSENDNISTEQKSNLTKVYRPTGINTIHTRLGDPPGGCDIRGDIVNPKFAVSPWNNSNFISDKELDENQKVCYYKNTS